MHMKKTVFVAITLISIALGCSGQDYKFGIRAGLNFNTLLAPVEQSTIATESYSYTSGFHFGVTWDYYITDILTIKTELSYLQNGTGYSYDGDMYYKIYVDDEEIVYEQGYGTQKLEITNAALSIPAMVSYQITPKWEIFGGGYANILVQSSGGGELEFNSYENFDNIRFFQSLDYNFSGDDAREFNTLSSTRIVRIRVNDEVVGIPGVVGAYYQYDEDEKAGKMTNRIDLGLTAGVNYFFNKGFYFSVRGQYGLLDVTNNDVDRVLTNLSADNDLLFSDDKDLHFGIQTSLGFRF